jgi:L-amino acid N-acyltransferase YncA
VIVVPMSAEHWPEVQRIYAAGIADGNATFESEVPDWATWDAAHLPAHRLVSLDADEQVTGWAAVSPVSERCVYAGVVEHSIYVDPAAQGRGTGRALLTALIESTERSGIWTIQSGVFPENTVSLVLHEQLGFRRVGTRERLGRDAGGRWRDVVLIERRSPQL